MPTTDEQLAEVVQLIRIGRPTPAERLILAMIRDTEPQMLLRWLTEFRDTIAIFFIPSQRIVITQMLESKLPADWEWEYKEQLKVQEQVRQMASLPVLTDLKLNSDRVLPLQTIVVQPTESRKRKDTG